MSSNAAQAVSQSAAPSYFALAPEQFSSLLRFVPDTPWTTTTIHTLQRKQGRAFVDAPSNPRNVVVVAPGDPAARTLDRAFLFGSARSDALRQFLASLRVPTEVVCDGEVADIVRELHPDARMKQSIVFWYERCEDGQTIIADPGARRLRISESDGIAPLVPGHNLRTFRTVRDLVTGGSAFVVESEGQIVSCAYTVDHSVKFERMAVATREDHRREGRGTLAGRRLVKCIADQSRMPCAIVERTDLAGLALAAKMGFTQQAQMRSFTTRLKSL
jgi:hypothetical protein